MLKEYRAPPTWRVAIAEHNLGRADAIVDSQVNPSRMQAS